MRRGLVLTVLTSTDTGRCAWSVTPHSMLHGDGSGRRGVVPIRPVSAAWNRTVTGSHTMVAEARVCETFQTGTDPDGTTVSILAGAVTLDASADVRSTLDLTVDGTALWPTFANSLLAPYGNEIFVRRGIQYGIGVTEWVSLGYF